MMYQQLKGKVGGNNSSTNLSSTLLTTNFPVCHFKAHWWKQFQSSHPTSLYGSTHGLFLIKVMRMLYRQTHCHCVAHHVDCSLLVLLLLFHGMCEDLFDEELVTVTGQSGEDFTDMNMWCVSHDFRSYSSPRHISCNGQRIKGDLRFECVWVHAFFKVFIQIVGCNWKTKAIIARPYESYESYGEVATCCITLYSIQSEYECWYIYAYIYSIRLVYKRVHHTTTGSILYSTIRSST